MIQRPIKLSAEPHQFSSLHNFLTRKTSPSGPYEIQHGLPIHASWEDRGEPVTFVALSGAISPKVRTVPAYGGYGTTRTLNANRLLISDPTLILDETLRLAWYGGSTMQPTLQHDLTDIITSFAGDTRVVLFGPSGGGFAALDQATRIPGSTAVVSNPQTDMKLFTREAVERYLSDAWGIGELRDDLPFRSSVLEAYRQPVDARIVYLQNLGDTDHVERHWQPFLTASHPDNRVYSMTPNLGDGHKGPDKASFVRVFETVCDIADWGALTGELDRIELTRNV